MADNTEQLKTAVQILAQVSDRAMVDGPTGRQRDTAIQILAKHFGLETAPSAQGDDSQEDTPVIEMPDSATN